MMIELTTRLVSLAVAVVIFATPYAAAQSVPTSAAQPARPEVPPPQPKAPAATPAPQAKPAAPPPQAKPAAPPATPPPASAGRATPPAAGTPTAPVAPTPPATQGAQAGPQLEPQGFTYDAAGRRDPFVSLLRRGGDVQRPTTGSRAAGLAGLETSEVTLKGTLASRGSYVGILQGSDNKTYIVKAGDKLLDGTIRTINPDSLVITQQVTDPLSLEKQREVRKVLRQTEEAK